MKLNCIRTSEVNAIAQNTLFRLLFLVFLAVIQPISIFADDLDEEIRELEAFTRTYHLIQSQYIEFRSARQLTRAAIEGMVSGLDPYSEAIDRSKLEELKSDATGRFVGIGISIQKDNNRQIVTQVIKDSPSYKAGLRPGDVLVRLNGVVLSDQTESKLSHLVRGEVGSSLTLSFYHPDLPDNIIKKEIQRAVIHFPSVESFEADAETIVIQIIQFQKATPDEIASVLSAKPYQAVLIDLRNNPGGLFLAAVETAELFLDGGDIVVTRDRHNRVIERYIARSKDRDQIPRVAVMMNRYSASSAEIVAGAIKDRNVGKIVGEKSYGKGVVQTVFPLGDDLYVKLTTARYFTPSGISFHEVGIQPDHPVKDTIRAVRYGADDQIYAAALDLVRNRKDSVESMR